MTNSKFILSTLNTAKCHSIKYDLILAISRSNFGGPAPSERGLGKEGEEGPPNMDRKSLEIISSFIPEKSAILGPGPNETILNTLQKRLLLCPEAALNQIVQQVAINLYTVEIQGGLCRQKHRHKNTDSKIGPRGVENPPETRGKRPPTSNTPTNSGTLPRPNGFLYQRPYCSM